MQKEKFKVITVEKIKEIKKDSLFESKKKIYEKEINEMNNFISKNKKNNKSKEKESALIAFTSIFLIPAFYSIALNIRKFKSSDWKALFNDWFGKDDTFIHNEEKEKNLRRSLYDFLC